MGAQDSSRLTGSAGAERFHPSFSTSSTQTIFDKHTHIMDLSSLTGKSATGAGASSATSAERKEAIKQQVSSELAMANAQQLITKATEKCYAKCIPAPGSSLSGKEQTCLTRCMERYFEAFNIVSSTYVRRVGNERAAGAVVEAGL